MVLRHRIRPPRDIFPVDSWAFETFDYTGQYLRSILGTKRPKGKKKK